jgi:hypothetical protein
MYCIVSSRWLAGSWWSCCSSSPESTVVLLAMVGHAGLSNPGSSLIQLVRLGPDGPAIPPGLVVLSSSWLW